MDWWRATDITEEAFEPKNGFEPELDFTRPAWSADCGGLVARD